MTNVSISTIQHIAKLSNLQISEQEQEALRVDIENILTNVEKLESLNTDGVEPTYQVTDLTTVWRDDTVDAYGISSDELVALAPDSEAHQIKVPKVL